MNQNEKQKQFHKDFVLVVIGQIISLFGNAILRFALPLYLLNETGNAAYFGLAGALSFLPMILLTPIGGMIADRVNKRNIMVILDFSTAGLVLIFFLLLGNINLVGLLIVTLMLLYGIQGIYQPAVQASMPLLASEEKLLTANAIINQVSALSGLLGPVIGGILFGFWGIFPILLIGGICFFLSAVMEIFIHIPMVKVKREKGFFAMVKHDFQESMHFILREKPVIFKGVFIVAGINLFLSALLIIGMPILITRTLGMSDQLYGYCQGALAAGGLTGGILTGVFAKRLQIDRTARLLMGCAILLVPMGAALILPISTMLAYLMITVCGFCLMAASTIFSIQMLSFVQGQTPVHLTGKVISWVLALAMCSQPVGQAMYGALFQYLEDAPHLIIFGAAIISMIIAFFSGRVFGQIHTQQPVPEINR